MGRGRADSGPSLLWLLLLLEMQGGPTGHPDPLHTVDARASRHHYCEFSVQSSLRPSGPPLSAGIPNGVGQQFGAGEGTHKPREERPGSVQQLEAGARIGKCDGVGVGQGVQRKVLRLAPGNGSGREEQATL